MQPNQQKHHTNSKSLREQNILYVAADENE